MGQFTTPDIDNRQQVGVYRAIQYLISILSPFSKNSDWHGLTGRSYF